MIARIDLADIIMLGGAKCSACGRPADYVPHIDAFRCRACRAVCTTWRSAVRCGAVALTFVVAACTAAPVRPVPSAPSIPTTSHETWRCAAPGAPAVLVEGTPEPARVEVGGVSLDCRLVPLGR